MASTIKYPDEVVFCVKYLIEKGYCTSKTISDIEAQAKNFNKSYSFVRRMPENFFTELAESLRKLWPAGEKEGKWPWRDSVANLTIRLETLWTVRGLGDYSLEDCLMVARRYLARYQDDKRYMKTLKYFILRQNEEIVDANGKIHHNNQSQFADMLEGKDDVDAATSEWEELFESDSTMSDNQQWDVV